MSTINTDSYSARLRPRMLNHDERSISVTNFASSAQSSDLSNPPNCHGFGRRHLFEVEAFNDWPINPLPIRPALRALDQPPATSINAQVFQNAGCNWRCWYCFVPFADLTTHNGVLVPVETMVDCTLADNPDPHMVDLSGGQPDLTPEWPVWFLQALDARSVDRVYVWSDDNLSTDYLWRYLTPAQIAYLGEHPRYGRACCIKGFDPESFAFNTSASPDLFARQFELLHRIRTTTKIDYYVYLTITTPTTNDIEQRMRSFVDRLQSVHEYLPLRCVPLKILEWGPVSGRLNPERRNAMTNQLHAVELWLGELAARFPGVEESIENVPR
ncbi:hypothetical protein MTY414_00080 [Mycolicibacterium mageritense]|nr:hypothetical protein MTY414_00080 [Mycolicibacterium mageritense]